jgi:hypothetical protein
VDLFRKPKPIGFDYTPKYFKGETQSNSSGLYKGFLSIKNKRQLTKSSKKIAIHRLIILLFIMIFLIAILQKFIS